MGYSKFRAFGWLMGVIAAIVSGMALVPAQAQTAIPAITVTPSTANAVQPTPTSATALTSYRGDQYTILYPTGWKVIPRDNNNLYFGPNSAPACGSPGIIISPVGLLSTTETPDIMLNNFLTANNYLTEVGSRVDLSTLGRTATFEGACTDGTTRKFRVTMYTASSKGFQVEEYAPKASFDPIDPTFIQIAQSFTPLTPTGQQPVAAPNQPPPTLLIHLFEGNLFMASVADLPGTPLTRDADLIGGTVRYTQPAVAPGGKLIAFVSQPSGDLLIAPLVKDGQAERLPLHVTPHFPIAWRADGTAIAFVNQKGNQLTVNVITLKDNVVAQVGSLTGAPCATPPIGDPAIAVWDADLDAVDANGDTLMLAWIDAKTIVVSTDCTGSQVGLLDLTSGTLNPIGTPGGFIHVALSPDGLTLAGSANGMLALINLADGKIVPLTTPADRVAWSPDSKTIFSGARTQPTPLILSTASNGIQPFQSAIYQLTVYSTPIATGKGTQLYSGLGFAIGSLAPSPDRSGIVLTTIQDDSAILKVLAKPVGTNDLLQAQPLPQMYWLPLNLPPGSAPTLLIDTDHVLFGPLGSTAQIGLPVTPPGPDFNNLGG